MAGWLGGLWISEQRLANVAPQALVRSQARDDVSAKLVDESNNRQWQTWDNGEKGAALPISGEHPEFITLTWPKAVPLSGICLLWTGFSAVEVEAFSGSASEVVNEAADSKWERVAEKEHTEVVTLSEADSGKLMRDRAAYSAKKEPMKTP